MKKYLLITLLIPALAFSQKKKNNGFAYLGPSVFVSAGNGGLGNFGALSAGAGYAVDNHFSIGASLDGYFFTNQHKFGTAKLDLSAFFKGVNTKFSPFISAQPGWNITSYQTKVSTYGYSITKGGFAFDVLAGIKTKVNNKAGVYFAVGYSNITFTTNNVRTAYGGFKAKICLSI